MNKIFLSCLCLFVFVVKASATNYYVATNGNNTANNGTTVATPFLTIQKAADVLVSGDVVFVRAGVYREMVNLKADGVTYVLCTQWKNRVVVPGLIKSGKESLFGSSARIKRVFKNRILTYPPLLIR